MRVGEGGKEAKRRARLTKGERGGKLQEVLKGKKGGKPCRHDGGDRRNGSQGVTRGERGGSPAREEGETPSASAQQRRLSDVGTVRRNCVENCLRRP